jgi:hypothetical protein
LQHGLPIFAALSAEMLEPDGFEEAVVIVDPLTPVKLSSALGSHIHKPRQLIALRKRAAQYYQQHFAVVPVEKQIAEVYRYAGLR